MATFGRTNNNGVGNFNTAMGHATLANNITGCHNTATGPGLRHLPV